MFNGVELGLLLVFEFVLLFLRQNFLLLLGEGLLAELFSAGVPFELPLEIVGVCMFEV